MEDVTEKPRVENQQSRDKENFSPERGGNVSIILKFIRHGERTPQTTLPSGEVTGGTLTDYGREVTRQRALESKAGIGHVNVVGAMGSDAGLKGPTGMQRSLETADIYASEIPADKRLKTRGASILSYETQVIPMPLDWDKIYNKNLPDNFATLSDEEKAKASKAAQAAVLNNFMSLQTPEAIAYRKELAGSFARVIDHYMRAIKGVKSGTKALLPQGTHGGRMEPFLKEALSSPFRNVRFSPI